MGQGKIGLIIGDTAYPRIAHTFVALTKEFEVTVYLIQKENILSQVPMPMKAHLFREEEQTPGFLRDAEDSLKKEDLLICINVGSLSSLQAARVARDFGKPLICYVGDYDLNRYTRYQNLNSIMELILGTGSTFLVPHRSLEGTLIKAGISEHKVRTLSPKVISRFREEPEKRSKFRRYIGLNEHDLMLLYFGKMEKECLPESALQAFRLQESLCKDRFSSFKIVLAGQGESVKDLQYLSYNLGIGQATYFLTQDTEPFVEDLFAASDLMICPPDYNEDSLPGFPYQIAEAMACGVIPLVPEGSVSAMLVDHKHLQWDGKNYDSLAFAMKRVLGSKGALTSWRRYVQDYVTDQTVPRSADAMLEKLVSDLLEHSGGRVEPSPNIPWSTLSGPPASDAEAVAIIEKVEKIDIARLSRDDRSKLHLCKAEALKALLRYDDAFWEYEQSVQWNDNQVQAYCGMGFISWYSYNNEEALTFFKKALAISPHEQESMLGIGLVYKRLVMTDDALFWLEKSVLTGECSNFALKALIQTCNECQDQKQAIDILERVLEAVGDRKILMTGLGNLYLKAGYVEIAHQIFSRYLDAESTEN